MDLGKILGTRDKGLGTSTWEKGLCELDKKDWGLEIMG